MPHELYYTSAPAGLAPGTFGFCIVAATRGFPEPLQGRLEALSGYRAVYPSGHQKVTDNPVGHGHWIVTAGTKTYHILSRVAFAGPDYTGRTNKFAHHLALDAGELTSAGPAWLLGASGVMETAWSGEPRQVEPRRLPPGIVTAKPCSAWAARTGDAGWAGVVAEVLAKSEGQVCLVFESGMDMLPLVAEVLALLPSAKRWAITFSTYETAPPRATDCRLYCCVKGDTKALPVVQGRQGFTIDLTTRLGNPPSGEWTDAARKGRQPEGDPQQAGRPGASRAAKGLDLSSKPQGLDLSPPGELDLSGGGDDDSPYKLADDWTPTEPTPNRPRVPLTTSVGRGNAHYQQPPKRSLTTSIAITGGVAALLVSMFFAGWLLKGWELKQMPSEKLASTQPATTQPKDDTPPQGTDAIATDNELETIKKELAAKNLDYEKLKEELDAARTAQANAEKERDDAQAKLTNITPPAEGSESGGEGANIEAAADEGDNPLSAEATPVANEKPDPGIENATSQPTTDVSNDSQEKIPSITGLKFATAAKDGESLKFEDTITVGKGSKLSVNDGKAQLDVIHLSDLPASVRLGNFRVKAEGDPEDGWPAHVIPLTEKTDAKSLVSAHSEQYSVVGISDDSYEVAIEKGDPWKISISLRGDTSSEKLVILFASENSPRSFPISIQNMSRHLKESPLWQSARTHYAGYTEASSSAYKKLTPLTGTQQNQYSGAFNTAITDFGRAKGILSNAKSDFSKNKGEKAIYDAADSGVSDTITALKNAHESLKKVVRSPKNSVDTDNALAALKNAEAALERIEGNLKNVRDIVAKVEDENRKKTANESLDRILATKATAKKALDDAVRALEEFKPKAGQWMKTDELIKNFERRPLVIKMKDAVKQEEFYLFLRIVRPDLTKK